MNLNTNQKIQNRPDFKREKRRFKIAILIFHGHGLKSNLRLVRKYVHIQYLKFRGVFFSISFANEKYILNKEDRDIIDKVQNNILHTALEFGRPDIPD